MTQDEIIRMARDADKDFAIALIALEQITPFLERFAALVAAYEREKLAEQEPVAFRFPRDTESWTGGWTIDYKVIRSVDAEIEDNEFKPCLESVEQVLLALEKVCAAPQPVKQEPVGWLDECGVFRSAEDWDLSGVEGAIPLHTGLQTSQKPVGVIKLWESETGFQNADYEFYGLPIGTHKLYAAPVRTKDLTDDEILEAVGIRYAEPHTKHRILKNSRAVIAPDREKNRAI